MTGNDGAPQWSIYWGTDLGDYMAPRIAWVDSYAEAKEWGAAIATAHHVEFINEATEA